MTGGSEEGVVGQPGFEVWRGWQAARMASAMRMARVVARSAARRPDARRSAVGSAARRWARPELACGRNPLGGLTGCVQWHLQEATQPAAMVPLWGNGSLIDALMGSSELSADR